MQIRRAESEDDAVVSRLRLEFLAELRSIRVDDLADGFRDQTLAFVADTRRSGAMVSWLAGNGDGVVGLVSVLLHGLPPRPEDVGTNEGYIVNMYVRPSARGRGVGRALFDTCLASRSELGIRRFSLHSTDEGRPLYLRSGFATDHERMDLQP